MGNRFSSVRANVQENIPPQGPPANFTASGAPFIHIDPRVTINPEAIEQEIKHSAPVQELKQDCTDMRTKLTEVIQTNNDLKLQITSLEEKSAYESGRIEQSLQMSGQSCSRKEVKALQTRQERQFESHKRLIVEHSSDIEKVKVVLNGILKGNIKTSNHFSELKEEQAALQEVLDSMPTRTSRVPLQTRIEEMAEGHNPINQSPRSNSSDDSHYLELQLEEPQVRYREDEMLGRSRRPLQSVDTNNQQQINWDSNWMTKGYKELNLPSGLYKKMEKEEAQKLGTDLFNLLREHGVDIRREISEYPNLRAVVKDFLAANPQQGWAIQIFSDQKCVKPHQSKHLVLMFGRIGINLMGFEKKRHSN